MNKPTFIPSHASPRGARNRTLKNVTAILAIFATVTSQNAFSAGDEFTVRFTQQSLAPLPPAYFAHIGFRQAKVVLAIPNGFRTSHNPDRRDLRLISPGERASITLQFHSFPPDAAPTSVTWREVLLARFNGARVIEEFPTSAAGANGLALDLAWNNGGKNENRLRAMFMPVGAQWLELTLLATSDNFENDRHALNQVALSLRAAEGTEPQPPVLSNKI